MEEEQQRKLSNGDRKAAEQSSKLGTSDGRPGNKTS
jgi:hypothetical protein